MPSLAPLTIHNRLPQSEFNNHSYTPLEFGTVTVLCMTNGSEQSIHPYLKKKKKKKGKTGSMTRKRIAITWSERILLGISHPAWLLGKHA